MVTIAADSEETKDERLEKAFFVVEPNQEELAEIARLLDAWSFNASSCCGAVCQSVQRLLRDDRCATRPREDGAFRHHRGLAASPFNDENNGVTARYRFTRWSLWH